MSERSVADIPDEELLLRALRNINPRRKKPRWSAVMDAFGLGSTYAHQLCARFDLDPDEEIRSQR